MTVVGVSSDIFARVDILSKHQRKSNRSQKISVRIHFTSIHRKLQKSDKRASIGYFCTNLKRFCTFKKIRSPSIKTKEHVHLSLVKRKSTCYRVEIVYLAVKT